MDTSPARIQLEEWVVYIFLTVRDTFIWEGVISGFNDKSAAEQWQKVFMEKAPPETYSSLVLTDIAPSPVEISAYLTREVVQKKSRPKED